MNLVEIGWGGVNSIGLAQDGDKLRTTVKAVMNVRVSSNFGKLSSDYTTGGGGSRAFLSSTELVS
jgi:hypothetical protein